MQALGDTVWAELGLGQGSGNWQLTADGSSVAHSVSPALYAAGTEALRDEMRITRDLQVSVCL